MDSDSDYDMDKAEADESEKDALEQLRNGILKIGKVNGQLICPLSPNKGKRMKYTELEQHASSIMKGDNDNKRRGEHAAVKQYMEEALAYMAPAKVPKKHRIRQDTPVRDERVGSFVFPPAVVVYNIDNNFFDNDIRAGATDKDLKDYFSLFQPKQAKSFWNTQGHLGTGIVEFADDFNGLIEALRLAEFFADRGCGRREFEGCKDPSSRKTELYGWLAVSEDFEKSLSFREKKIGTYLREKSCLKSLVTVHEEKLKAERCRFEVQNDESTVDGVRSGTTEAHVEKCVQEALRQERVHSAAEIERLRQKLKGKDGEIRDLSEKVNDYKSAEVTRMKDETGNFKEPESKDDLEAEKNVLRSGGTAEAPLTVEKTANVGEAAATDSVEGAHKVAVAAGILSNNDDEAHANLEIQQNCNDNGIPIGKELKSHAIVERQEEKHEALEIVSTEEAAGGNISNALPKEHEDERWHSFDYLSSQTDPMEGADEFVKLFVSDVRRRAFILGAKREREEFSGVIEKQKQQIEQLTSEADEDRAELKKYRCQIGPFKVAKSMKEGFDTLAGFVETIEKMKRSNPGTE